MKHLEKETIRKNMAASKKVSEQALQQAFSEIRLNSRTNHYKAHNLL